MNRTYVSLLPGTATAPCVALEDQYDLVLGQFGGRKACVQLAGRAGPVTPPTVGTTAHDVRAVDDQNLHPPSVWGRRAQLRRLAEAVPPTQGPLTLEAFAPPVHPSEWSGVSPLR